LPLTLHALVAGVLSGREPFLAAHVQNSKISLQSHQTACLSPIVIRPEILCFWNEGQSGLIEQFLIFAILSF
jgi:hypothetical protein